MNLSTNELFHFTRFENLKSIITAKSFFPRFNLEFTLLSENYNRRAALLPVAMVCFCDIPFNLSIKHRERYGDSGIVLSEKWKLNKGLNPVLYIQAESYLANVLANLTNIPDRFLPIIDKTNRDLEITQTLGDIANNLTFFTYFLKQFENKKMIKINYGGKIRSFEKRKFYDEREWRYIPFEADKDNKLFITIWDFDNPIKLEKAHKELEKYELTFSLEDIKYLVVNNFNKKNELNNVIRELYDKEIEIRIVQ